MFHLLALLGALPALVAMLIVDRADARRPEPRWTLRRVSIAGAFAVIPAALVELALMALGPQGGLEGAIYTGFVVAALVEEGAKALCLRWFVWNRPEFDERTDGIVYGTRAGLGFALVENIGYLLGTKTMIALVGVFFLRALLAVPMHAITGGLMGHFAAWKRFEGRGPGMLGGYLLAVFLHGAYDAALFALPTLAVERRYGLVLLVMLCPLAVVVGGLLLLRRAWRQALAGDDAASVRLAA